MFLGQRRSLIAALSTVLISSPFLLKSADPLPIIGNTTQLLQPILTPVTQTLLGLPSLLSKARDLKLLVISADGTDPSFSAIKANLDQIGVPYDAVVLTQTGGALPPLENHSKGFYQGFILSTGNLVTCTTNPCSLALPPSGWLALDKYAVSYGVRILSYYTFPDPRYGLAWDGTAQQNGSASFLAGASNVFRDLNRSNTIPVMNSYFYGALPVAGAGETTTPILSIGGRVAGVVHRKGDGREYLALTFDHNPYLLHSVALGYDLVSWVTKGLFIGSRKAYYSPQIDDVFIGSDLYATAPGCQPPGFQLDPTADPSANCPTVRIDGGDLSAVAAWQDQVNSSLRANIKVTMAFNGFGTTAQGGALPNDSLMSSASANRSRFFWITHTYNHENLDCYNPVPNSGVCVPATYAQSLAEIDSNRSVSRNLNLSEDTTAMVTPNISGLNNPNFLSAAAARGIRYVVMDTSMATGLRHNTGVNNPLRSSILMVPRRPTNIFYNTRTGYSGAPGSQPDEYNYFYGPFGIIRIGGPGGPPFFNTIQSHAEIINREAENMVMNMLRGDVYPVMFHQANLSRYYGSESLFSEVSSATLSKFRALTNIPVRSLSLSQIADIVQDRMAFNQSNVSATLLPGLTLTIRASRSAEVAVTGLCRSNCESNGANAVSRFNVNPLLPTLVLLP